MRRALAVALVLAAAAPAAWAKAADDDEEDDADDEDDDDDEGSSSSAAKGGDDEEDEDDGLPRKQNLSGKDLGTKKKPTEFERDRFFVDKVDTEATEDATLVQGSLASSSFFYGERGGDYPMLMNAPNTGPRRMFTELRLQTDFRHIKGSRWEARVDTRARVVNSPPNASYIPEGGMAAVPSPPNRIQSGLFGTNELELRELWLVRSGTRSDVFIGRQFIPDLGGMKFDGVRVDYAKSARMTLIGYGGLMPVRGSRSVTTDYLELKNEEGEPAGRLVATGGFGGAYRTPNAYGALGAAVQAPLKVSAETPRVFLTSNGYLRNGPKLDVFHYALLDILGTGAEDSTGRIQLTNLSGGLNYKPNQRLRLTAALHRVDTETLAVHAGAFLNTPDVDPMGVGPTVVQNEAYIQRIATNQARGGVSAALGAQNRFEVSTAVSYRYRPSFTLRSPDRITLVEELPAAASVEVWGSFVDRRSIMNTRIGVDVSRSFAAGQLAYQRSIALIARLFVLREIAGGRGEWEAEVTYSDIKDTIIGNAACTMLADCYGASNNSLFSAGGQLFYRLKQDWFALGTMHLLRITNRRSDGVVDPAVLGLTGFVRIAKRF